MRKASVVSRISIAAKRTEVFQYLTDLKRHHLWSPQMLSISTLENLKLDSVYETVILLLSIEVPTTNVVTKFIRDKEFELESKTGIIEYRAHFRLNNKGSGTMLVCTTEVSSDSNAFAFAAPILKLLARRELQADMQALKIAVEHKLE